MHLRVNAFDCSSFTCADVSNAYEHLLNASSQVKNAYASFMCLLRMTEMRFTRMCICQCNVQTQFEFLQFITNLMVIPQYRQLRTDNGRTSTVRVSRDANTDINTIFIDN